MKKLIYFLILFTLLGAAGASLQDFLSGFESSGYVLIGIDRWTMETSLLAFIIGLVVVFTGFYIGFRLLGLIIRLPKMMRKRVEINKLSRSQQSLVEGLLDSAEGNWEKAEEILIKHAGYSDKPLVHYLTAAKAAQSRGAIEKRDEYLKIASEQSQGSTDIAVGLTQAELHLSGQQFNEALETLMRLHSINPTHASVLKLLHKTYQQLGDWQSLKNLIPSLNNNKVLMEAEIKLVETEVFSNLLREAAQTKDAIVIERLWSEIPTPIKVVKGVSAIYFAAMIEAGASAKIENELSKALSANWNDTLLALFGNIISLNPLEQLTTAERWLLTHKNDFVLLMVLGKISVQCGDLQKAISYFSQSLSVEPNVQSYQLLGDIFTGQGNLQEAIHCYKQALELASKTIVNQVEHVY